VLVPFKDNEPFFELDDDSTSEEIESLRKTRTHSMRHYISKFELREIDKID
jgi:hypothetical protein